MIPKVMLGVGQMEFMLCDFISCPNVTLGSTKRPGDGIFAVFSVLDQIINIERTDVTSPFFDGLIY